MLDPPPSGEPEVFDRLCRRLQEDTDLRRKWAAEDLAYLGDPAATEPLIAALTNPCETVRLAVIAALGEIGDARAIAPLVGLAQLAEDALSATDAICALGSLAVRYPEHSRCFAGVAPVVTELAGMKLSYPAFDSPLASLRRTLGLDLPIPATPAAPPVRDLPVAAGLNLRG